MPQIRNFFEFVAQTFFGMEKAREALKIKDSRAFKPFLFRSIYSDKAYCVILISSKTAERDEPL